MSNCIIAGFCSYVNRYRQYCCIIRKNGARRWLFAGKGRRRDAGIGELRRRLYIRLSQSLRRSHNRLGDPTVASAIAGGTRSARVRQTSQRRHTPSSINARRSYSSSKESIYPHSCAKRFRLPFAKGGGSEAQSPRPPRRKTESARKRVQAGAAFPALKGIRRFMRLAFCPLVVRQSAALPPGSRAAGQPLPPIRRQRLHNFVRRERARIQWVSIPRTLPLFFRRRSPNTKRIGRIGSQKRTFPAYTDDIRI